MTCPFCDREIPDDAVLCAHCGKTVDIPAAEPVEHKLLTVSGPCPGCGLETSAFRVQTFVECSHCHAALKYDGHAFILR